MVKGGKTTDKYRWRCAHPCRREESIREGSLFAGSKLKLKYILQLIYYWVFEESTSKKMKRELKLTRATLCKWKCAFRAACSFDLLAHPCKVGGPGVIVQIDETCFVRRKYNRGRLVSQQWVFGGIDCSTKQCFLVPVDRRDAETLLPVIIEYVLPGSIIVSDLWRAYSSLYQFGYTHYTVNHSLHFVDPITRMNTNRVENLWMRAKMRNKREAGTSRRYLESYLVEFMWRQVHKEYVFEEFIRLLALIYPVN